MNTGNAEHDATMREYPDCPGSYYYVGIDQDPTLTSQQRRSLDRWFDVVEHKRSGARKRGGLQ